MSSESQQTMTASLYLIVGSAKFKSVGLFDYGPRRGSEDYPNSGTLPFDTPSTFKIHPFKRLLCGEGPGLNSAVKSAKTCPLIIVLDLKVTPRGLIFVTHFAIFLVALRFSTIALRGYSVSTMIGKN